MWIVQHFTLKSKLAVVKQEEEEEIDWMNRIEITDGICSLLYACHCTRPLVRLKGIICKHLHWGEGGGRYFQVFTALARFCVSPCCCWVGFGIWCLEPTFFAADRNPNTSSSESHAFAETGNRPEIWGNTKSLDPLPFFIILPLTH